MNCRRAPRSLPLEAVSRSAEASAPRAALGVTPPRALRALGALTLLLAAPACADLIESEPENDLGTFQVTATMTETTCGPGALDAPAVHELTVQLTDAGGGRLYWAAEGGRLPGTLASDGKTFGIETERRARVVEKKGDALGCVVTSREATTGTLAAAENAASFAATLLVGYVGGVADDCSPVIGVPGWFATLPCEMTYTLVGTRIAP